MNKKSNIHFASLALLLCLSYTACKKDSAGKPPEPKDCESAYTNDIVPVVSSKCATSGCHVANSHFGDFRSYGDLKTRVDNGKVNRLVFEENLMPPASSPKLTADELAKLKCWIDHGAAQD